MSRNRAEWTRKPDVTPGFYVDLRIYTDPEIFEEERAKIFDQVRLDTRMLGVGYHIPF